MSVGSWCHRTKLAEDDQTATIAANQKENSPARYLNDFPVKSPVFAWTRCAAAPTQLMLRETLLLMCSPYSRATQSAKANITVSYFFKRQLERGLYTRPEAMSSSVPSPKKGSRLPAERHNDPSGYSFISCSLYSVKPTHRWSTPAGLQTVMVTICVTWPPGISPGGTEQRSQLPWGMRTGAPREVGV